MNKKLLLILFPLVSLFIIWIFLKTTSFSVLDSKDLEFSTFTDKNIDNGKSEIIEEENTSAYKAIRFELNEGFISPYAGVSFFMKDKYWDLTDYDLAEIEIELQNTKNLELTIATYQNGVTKENEPLTFRHNVIEIPVSDNTTLYRLQLDRMHIAQWWLERFKLRSTELKEADWSKAKSISFVAKIRLDETKPQYLKINKITFVKSLTKYYIFSVIFILLWILALLIYYKLSGSKKEPSEIIIKYQQIESETLQQDDSNELFDFISTHYTDPGLSLQQISRTLKISEKTISRTIKKRFNITFKEYLNGIRVAEAKRLLALDNKNVSEIAYQVGFNSPNHFNRVFKTSEGCTPSDYKNGAIIKT